MRNSVLTTDRQTDRQTDTAQVHVLSCASQLKKVGKFPLFFFFFEPFPYANEFFKQTVLKFSNSRESWYRSGIKYYILNGNTIYITKISQQRIYQDYENLRSLNEAEAEYFIYLNLKLTAPSPHSGVLGQHSPLARPDDTSWGLLVTAACQSRSLSQVPSRAGDWGWGHCTPGKVLCALIFRLTHSGFRLGRAKSSV